MDLVQRISFFGARKAIFMPLKTGYAVYDGHYERVHLEIDIFDNDKKRELHVEVKSEIFDLTEICQNGVQTFLVIKAEFDVCLEAMC